MKPCPKKPIGPLSACLHRPHGCLVSVPQYLEKLWKCKYLHGAWGWFSAHLQLPGAAAGAAGPAPGEPAGGPQLCSSPGAACHLPGGFGCLSQLMSLTEPCWELSGGQNALVSLLSSPPQHLGVWRMAGTPSSDDVPLHPHTEGHALLLQAELRLHKRAINIFTPSSPALCCHCVSHTAPAPPYQGFRGSC